MKNTICGSPDTARFKEITIIDQDLSTRIVRAAFWIVGILVGAIMAYTTRHFINGDAIVYIEMGEALRTGEWARLANLTYSPAYPFLLGVAQWILQTNPTNELQVLRVVNVFCLTLVMAACELVLFLVRSELLRRREHGELPLPVLMVHAVGYAMCLLAALVLIRLRVINPDMLVCAIVLTAVATLFWIRENPISYRRYAVLGAVTGFGYLTKSFFFPFSLVFFVVAGLCARSVKRAVPRVLVAVLVMLIVSAPLVAALSSRLGRFTYGGLGQHVYALWISGEGEPIHPEILHSSPKTARFAYDVSCTRPSGFDICYWHEGFRPKLDFAAHARIIPGNLWGLFDQIPWLPLIALWVVVMALVGGFTVRSGAFPSHSLIMAVIGICGVAFYCLIHVEPRYLGPYLFFGFLSAVLCLKCPESDSRVVRRLGIISAVFVVWALSLVLHALVDQSFRGLQPGKGKPSYREAFLENGALKGHLRNHGVVEGDRVGLVGEPPVYWARMAGLRILGEIADREAFFRSTPQERQAALTALKHAGIKAVVGEGLDFARLAGEGWEAVPGTRRYYVRLL